MSKRTAKRRRISPPISRPRPQAKPEVPFDEQVRQIGWLALKVLAIAAAIFWIYYPAFHGGWLMDDDYYITKNATLRDPFGLWNIWLAPGSLVEYYPIESSIQWIEFQFWGEDSYGYHVGNVLMHIVDSLLVWYLFAKLRLRLAWLGGLIFAIHPAQVESVAWVAEFKNVLSTAPLILAMIAWIDYDETRSERKYYLSLGLFLVAMLCKISVCPFPVLILLYAWWKRDRVTKNDLIRSSPFFVISIALGILTIAAGKIYTPGHALEVYVPAGDLDSVAGVLSRLACIGLAITFYLTKFFLPGWLLPMYPHWIFLPPNALQFLPWPVFALVFWWLWQRRTTWGRHAIFALSFFLLFVATIVGTQKISFMRFTWVMDHFLYVPFIGFIGLVIAALAHFETLVSPATERYRLALLVPVLALFLYDSHAYAEMYVGQEELWTYTIEHNPEAWPAYNNLGNVLLGMNRLDEAKQRYQQALVLNPEYAEAHANLGIILARQGDILGGIHECKEALRINPDFPLVTQNLSEMEAFLQQQAPPRPR